MCRIFHRLRNLTRGWLTVSCQVLVFPRSGLSRGFLRKTMGRQRGRNQGDKEVCQAENQSGVAWRADHQSLEPPPSGVSGIHFSGVGHFSRRRCAIAHGNPPRSDLALTFDSGDISYFVRQNKRKLVRQSASMMYPFAENASYYTVFPLYNQASLDVLLLWKIPSQKQFGYV